VISALAIAGYSGAKWAEVVERVSDSVTSSKPINVKELESLIEDEKLDWKSLDVPSEKKETTATPTTPALPSSGNIDYTSLFNYISSNEGTGHGQVYNDSYGLPTIGIGHLLTDRSRAIFERLFGDSVDYNAILSKKQKLTRDQEIALFTEDVQSKLAIANRRIHDFQGLRQQTKNAIIDALFRGDLGPKTIALMNARQWEDASEEYLNHREYIKTRDLVNKGKKVNNRGIVGRMERNSQAFYDQAFSN
jgi:GH24 family phage-related lysozyme (muramidase)